MNIRKPIIYIGMILLLFVVLDMGFHWKSSSGDVMMETIKVQDSTGEFVTIPKHPKRVVFLNTANLEMYCAVGGREAVVGIPTTSIMSEELRQQVQGVEEVGIVHEPNIEKIISLQPDLVIGINVPMHNRVKEVLKENHIPFYINGLQSIEDTDRTVELYGRLTGDENEADALRKKIKEECDKALYHSRNKTAPRALILFASPNSQNMATGESFAGDIMKRLGGINIADVDSTIHEPYVPISMEYIIRKNPEAIFIVNKGPYKGHFDKVVSDMEKDELWGQVAAVKNKQVYNLPDTLFSSNPGSQVGEAMEFMANLLYGEES